MSEVALRVAGPDDADVLAPLVAGFRDHLKSAEPGDAALRLHLPRAMAEPNTEFACAWCGDDAVGYTQMRFHFSIWSSGHEAFLEDLWVEPRGRRRGTGRALLRHALERAAARGAVRLALSTNERNTAAHGLYRAMGLAPQSHALYPGAHEVVWSADLAPL